MIKQKNAIDSNKNEYYKQYLVYKEKYLKLKKKISNNSYI